MQTKIYQIDPQAPDMARIQEAGDIIRAGGLCAFPTETVYGLGGNALDANAAKKIYAAKGRPSDNPLIVHIASREALQMIVKDLPEKALALMDVYWPGPLTMIFEKTDAVPSATTGGLSTVAVRMPDHPVAQALIEASGWFIAAPSANRSGRPSTTDASHVIADLDGLVDVILDGGPANIGLESTIVDFTADVPMLLRPGYVSLAMLREVLGEVSVDPSVLSGQESTAPPKAPGMRYRHYAPQAALAIVRGEPARVADYVNEKTAEAKALGKRVGVLAATEHEEAYPGADVVIALGEKTAEREIARQLFDSLRRMDEAGVDYIYSEVFDTPQLGMAIMNRLTKAAGYQLFEV